jgi:hypothetical protein
MPHLVLYQAGQWQEIKQIRERLPDLRRAVFPQALVVEPIAAGMRGRVRLVGEVEVERAAFADSDLHLRDLPALVVASQDGDAIAEAHFECHQQRGGLNAATVGGGKGCSITRS